MDKLTKDDFIELDICPWGGDTESEFSFLYEDDLGCGIYRCEKCGIVFARRRLSESGLQKYWSDYESRVHVADDEVVRKRIKMYQIDYNYICGFKQSGKVLDVGCGNGDFLSHFKAGGYETFGVEFGKEAAAIAARKHDVWWGKFPQYCTDRKYDLIIFRGVLQYVPEPKKYLEKAISLLGSSGMIFVTAQPNMGSFCFNLFKKFFTQPVTGSDFVGYTEPILTSWFSEKGFRKVGEAYFYENTPYADIENDILNVARAVCEKQNGKEIEFKSPAFWGNMMSLVYQK